jgi:hypothetical protein
MRYHTKLFVTFCYHFSILGIVWSLFVDGPPLTNSKKMPWNIGTLVVYKRTWTLHKFFQEIFTFLKIKGRHLILSSFYKVVTQLVVKLLNCRTNKLLKQQQDCWINNLVESCQRLVDITVNKLGTSGANTLRHVNAWVCPRLDNILRACCARVARAICQ